MSGTQTGSDWKRNREGVPCRSRVDARGIRESLLAPLLGATLGLAAVWTGGAFASGGITEEPDASASVVASPEAPVFTHLAGSLGGPGQIDGTGSAARFSYPGGIAVDGAGNLYVADSYNHAIRRVTLAGVVTTLAGLAGYSGSADGTGSEARFYHPVGVAVDGAGNVYVGDRSNNTIRKVTPLGVVTTVAGLAGSSGSADGSGSGARFFGPSGIAVDGTGNVFVADTYNDTIRKVTPGGVVTTIAGLAGNSGSADGTGSAARFAYPGGVAVDGAGNVYVADTNNYTIRKVTPGGVVTTLAGLAGASGLANGTGSAARFSSPSGLTVDGAGNVFVANTLGHAIRMVTPEGVVTTPAGRAGYAGSADGTGSAARFSSPEGLAVDGSGNVYVADTDNSTVRRMAPGGVVTTLAGFPAAFGTADGTGSAARFDSPYGVAADPFGILFVADSSNYTIRKVTPGGVVTTLAGLAGSLGSADGTGSAARFNFAIGVALDGSGNLYVADAANNTVRKVTPGSVVTTLAGLAGSSGSEDGTGSAARFHFPTGVAVDGAGFVYVADEQNHTIRKVTPGGVVTTLAGLAGSPGSADGTGSAARFRNPYNVAADGAGNLYVTDMFNRTIRKVTPGGVVTTLAGLAGAQGSADGTGSVARFSYPEGLAVDGSGNVYVTDWNYQTVRRVTPGGVVTTVGGLAGVPGSADGTGSAARFNGPCGLALDGFGNLYIADGSNHAIRKGSVSTLQPPTADFSFSPGSPAAGRIVQFSDASGGAPVWWSWGFGDGGTSSLQNPTHVYSAAGSWPVWLTVLNAGGPSTITKTVSVRAAAPVTADFIGEGRASMAVYRPSTGVWYALSSGGSSTADQWGVAGDVPVPADYDGNGVTNVAAFRPSTGVWFVKGYSTTWWGVSTDVPVPGDFDGDGKADPAVFRPGTGTWFVSKSTGGTTSGNWGMAGDTPVSGDFDGDGKADYAVMRRSGGVMTWFVLKSDGGYTGYDAVQWGVDGDIPAPADYDGDGKADIAVFRPSTGVWYVRRSSDGGVTTRSWGVSGDIPQPADYDGDGKADIAVYRPGAGAWYVVQSSDGTVMSRSWGVAGDVPVTAPRY